MSTSIDEIKKFLSEKSSAQDTETLKVQQLGGTDSAITSYSIAFIEPEEDKPKKEAPKSEPVKKSSKK